MAEPSEEVEFRLEGRPFVPVHINGKGPFWLLFDTGCIGTRITPGVVESIELQSEVEEDLLNLAEFRIGGTCWQDLGVGVYAEPEGKKLLGSDFAGFIGNGFLWYVREEFVLSIDYPSRRLSFTSKDLDRSTKAVNVSLENYYTVVPVMLGRMGPYRFLLDTGANECAISKNLAATLGLPEGASTKARGIANELDGYKSRVRSLSVGTCALADLSVVVLPLEQASTYVHAPVDGIIGTNFLDSFKLTFNYSKPQIEFITTAHPPRRHQ